jgi:hypothetical protein
MNQPATKYRYFVGLSFLDIQEPLGNGDHLAASFRITNDKLVVLKFLTPELQSAMGGLEMLAMSNTDVYLYEEDTWEESVDPSECLARLTRFLELTAVFTTALWMVKDNAVNFELGFLEVWPPNGGYRAFSNFLAMTVRKSDGSKEKVRFSRDELREARQIFIGLLQVMNDGKPPEVQTPVKLSAGQQPILTSHADVPRLRRALYFLESARSFRDMGLKIAMFCSLFETLFSTDASEITHKIAHRIAIFLEQEPEKRCELYTRIKKAYGIRSKVVHGDEIKTESKEIQAISVDVDGIARRIFHKIGSSEQLFAQFHASKKELDDYFLKESFGGAPAPNIKTN